MRMTVSEFLVLLVVAAICGGIAQRIVGRSKGGCLASIALGFIGALFGPRLAEWADLPDMWVVQIGVHDFPILWSIIGASLFVAALGLLSGRKS